jgi:hypothetical protein
MINCMDVRVDLFSRGNKTCADFGGILLKGLKKELSFFNKILSSQDIPDYKG